MKYLFSLLILLLISLQLASSRHKFTLPQDPNWPTYEDFTSLKKSIQGKAHLRGESTYKPFTYNTRTNNPKPAIIVNPINENDVLLALQFSKKFNLRLAVQSTGHHMDIRNTADNSVLINMNSMRKMSINIEKQTVTVQTGAVFGEILKFVSEQSKNTLSVLSGADGSVGPYGFSVGGGHGRLSRLYGLGADAILNLKMMLSSGEIIDVNEQQNQDLFWALRGSGGQPYGIGLEITFRLYPDPGPVTTFAGVYKSDKAAGEMFGKWLIDAPNYMGAYYLPQNWPVPFITIWAFCFGDESKKCKEKFQPLKEGCSTAQEKEFEEYGVKLCVPEVNKFNTYDEYQLAQPQETGPENIYIVSTAVDKHNIVGALVETNEFIASKNIFQHGFIGCYGNGVMGGVTESLDPYGKKTSVPKPLRKAIMGITCYQNLDRDISQKAEARLIDQILNFSENTLKKYGNGYVYWNEPQHNFKSKEEWRSRYWGGMDQYNKLVEIKEKYDPIDFMTCYQCIGWNESADVDPAMCPNKECGCTNTPIGQCADTKPLTPQDYFKQDFQAYD